MRGATNATAGPKEGSHVLTFNGGLKIMWGTETVNANTTNVNITLPASFTGTGYSFSTAVDESTYGGNLWTYIPPRIISKASGSIILALSTPSGQEWPLKCNISWIAIGY